MYTFLPEFQQLITARYAYGDQVINADGLIAYVYSNNATVICGAVNAELSPGRAELISAE
jgi:hypothetical protein